MRTPVLFAVLFVACGKDAAPAPAAPPPAPASTTAPTSAAATPPAGATPTQQYIAGMRAWADAMCACKDDPCTERVTQEYGTRNAALAAKLGDESGTPEELAELQDIGARGGSCMTAAMQAGSTAK